MGIILILYCGNMFWSQLFNDQNLPSYGINLGPEFTPSLESYKSLKESQFPQEAKKIRKVWHHLNSTKIDGFEKLDDVSNEYISKLKELVYYAAYANENTLEKLSFQNKIRIYRIRQELLMGASQEELAAESFSDLTARYLYITLSVANYPKLEKIKFLSDTLAFTTFNVFGNAKSVKFEKESGLWKANTYEEDPSFAIKRNKFMKEKFREYGNERNYLDFLFKGSSNIRTPILKK